MRNVLRGLLKKFTGKHAEKRKLEERLNKFCASYRQAHRELSALEDELIADLKSKGIIVTRAQIRSAFRVYSHERIRIDEVGAALNAAIMRVAPAILFVHLTPIERRWEEGRIDQCASCPRNTQCMGALAAEILSGCKRLTR